MVWFGILRALTAHARWLGGLLATLLAPTKNYVILTPPLLRRQLIVRKSGRAIRVEIGSYEDWATLYHVFAGSEYSFAPFPQRKYVDQHYLGILKRGNSPIILDLGGNIGLTAIYFALEFPDAIILSVEPSSRNLELLRSNVRGIENIQIFHAAIASQQGRVVLKDPGLGFNAYRTGEDGQEVEEVEKMTVEQLLQTQLAAEPFLAKIDIEGAERELFSSNLEWVQKTPAIVIEPHDWLLPGLSTSYGWMSSLAQPNRDFMFRGEVVFSVISVS